MRMPKWLEKGLFHIAMKSLSYRVLIGENKDGQPYNEAHSDEDTLATDILFSKVPALHASIKAIASAVAMVPIRVVGPNGRERPNHPMAKLIQRPNDFDTTYDLMEQTAIFLECTGTMPWYLEGPGVDKGEPPETITPLHPNRVTPIPDRVKKIKGYQYKVEDRVMPMTRDEIVYFRYFDPSDPIGIRGLGPAEVAAYSATVDRSAANFNQKFFRRGAVLSGVIETDSEDIEPAVMERYAQQFRDRHSGSDKSWDVRGLSHGLKWKPTQPTHTDMLFEKMRQQFREEMLMSEGVPPVMVTLMDGSTYANAQQQEYAFMIATVLPKIRKIQARMNRDIASRYPDNVTFMFDVSEIRALQPNWKDIKETIVPLLERRTMNPDEARQFLTTGRMPKLEDVEHGKEFLTNFQITTLDGALDLDSPETPDVTEEEGEVDEVENLFSRMKDLASGLDAETHQRKNKREREVLRRVIERVFYNTSIELFEKQKNAILKFVEEKQFKQAGDDIGVLLGQLEDAYRSKYIGIYSEGVSQSGAMAMSALPVGFQYASDTVSALGFIESNSASLIAEIHDTTVTALRATLAEGVALGETTQGLALRVESVMGSDANKARALKIARTETNAAMNFGTLDAWSQTGVVQKKTWSIADGEARETHLEADGQVVGINESFQVGGSSLKHPGDTSQGADASEVINCRCAMEPVLAGEEASHEHSGISKGDPSGRVRHAGASEGSHENGKQGLPPVVASRLKSVLEGRGENGGG